MKSWRWLPALLLALILPGCATVVGTPYVPVQPDFRGISAPEKGFAKIYLLRPAFNAMSHADSPIFKVDGGGAITLPYGSYTDLQLAPGRHHLTVRPSARDSDVWNGDFDFEVAPDITYFLAAWNDVEHKHEMRAPGLVPFLIVNSLATDKNIALRIEAVTEEDALTVLRGSRYAEKTAEPPKP